MTEKTYLGGSQLGPQLLLLLITGEVGVDAINLVPELVDGTLKLVLLLVGLGNKLVFHIHGVFTLVKTGLGSLIDATVARDNRQVTLANLLLDLTGLLGLLIGLVGVHSLENR